MEGLEFRKGDAEIEGIELGFQQTWEEGCIICSFYVVTESQIKSLKTTQIFLMMRF